MLSSNKQKFVFFAAIVIIFAIALYIQSVVFMSGDISWLMEAARRLLRGGSYAHDFFETNPPLILFLYIPPVLFIKFTHLSAIWVFRGYVFLLFFLIFSFIYYLAKKGFSAYFLLGVALIWLLMPAFSFLFFASEIELMMFINSLC